MKNSNMWKSRDNFNLTLLWVGYAYSLLRLFHWMFFLLPAPDKVILAILGSYLAYVFVSFLNREDAERFAWERLVLATMSFMLLVVEITVQAPFYFLVRGLDGVRGLIISRTKRWARLERKRLKSSRYA